VAALTLLKVKSCLIDGEAVVFNEQGLADRDHGEKSNDQSVADLADTIGFINLFHEFVSSA
jgi:hypothetical protein